ncbi:cilia- and flagella-associated protein 251-like isoform X2 [Penaeus monodon]|nr:cilia- and flagella-associated protein 251-like isoform X2 [Penaeus monodon]
MAGYMTFQRAEGGGDVTLRFPGVEAPRFQETLSRDLPLSNWTRFDVSMNSTVLLVQTGHMIFKFDDEKIRSFKHVFVHVDKDRYMNVRFDCVKDTSANEVKSTFKESPSVAPRTTDPPSSGTNGGTVAAVIIILLVVLVACLGVWWWWRKRKEENTSSYNVQDVEKAMLEAGEAKGIAESVPLMASTSEGAAGGEPKGNFLTQGLGKLARLRKAVENRVRGREEDTPKEEGDAQKLCPKEGEREGDGERGENITKCQVGSKQEEAEEGRGDERQILENEQGEEVKEDTGRGEVKNGSEHEEREERETDYKKKIGESKYEETKYKELMKEKEDIGDEQIDSKENEDYREIEMKKEDKKERVGIEEGGLSEEEKENEKKEKRRDTEGKDKEKDEEEEQRKTKNEEKEEEADERAGKEQDEEQDQYENEEERKYIGGENQENEEGEDDEEQKKTRNKEEDSEEEAEEKQDEEEEEEEEEGEVGLGIGGAEGEEIQWRNPGQDALDPDGLSEEPRDLDGLSEGPRDLDGLSEEPRDPDGLSEEELRDIDMNLRLLAVQSRILSVIDEMPEGKRISQYEREERRKRSEEASEGTSGMRETGEGSVGKGKEEGGEEGVEKGRREEEEEEEEDNKDVE